MDITERKLAAIQIDNERIRLRTVLRTIPDMVWLKDKNGVYILCNPPFERLFGVTESEIVSKTDYDFVDQQLVDFVTQKDKEALLAGKPCVSEVAVTYADDGRKGLLETIKTPMLDSIGNVVGILGVARDISVRKAAEEALLKAKTDLEGFAYISSHNLQEPVRAVVAFSQLLQRHLGEGLDETGSEFLNHLINGARRMSEQVNDLAAYTGIMKRQSAFTEVNLDEVMAIACDNLRSQIEERNAAFEIASLPHVSGDRIQLITLFQNLIDNALKFTPSDHSVHVEISAQQDGDRWDIAIKDQGIGIAPQYHLRIFEIFQRLHAGTLYPGTGIGLATCKLIAQQHGGEIRVESEEGQGATFHVTLQGIPV